MVTFMAIGHGSDMDYVVRRLLGSEDARLVVVVVEGLALKEAVDVVNLELEVIDTLLDVDTAGLHLRECHLEGNEVLLIALHEVDHMALEAVAAALNRVGEAGLHLPEFVEDKTNGRIDGVSGFGASNGGIDGLRGLGAASVVMGVELHGSKRMIPDVRTQEEELRELDREKGERKVGRRTEESSIR
jgi:hypothetical protein